MSKFLHFAHWVGIVALMSSFFVFAPQAQAQVQTPNTYVVDVAIDTRFSEPPISGACSDNIRNKNCTMREAIILSLIHI